MSATGQETAWRYRFGAVVVLVAIVAGSYWAGSQPNRRLRAAGRDVLSEMEGLTDLGIVVQPVESMASIVIFENGTCAILFVFDDTVLDEPQFHSIAGPPEVCQQLFESHFIP